MPVAAHSAADKAARRRAYYEAHREEAAAQRRAWDEAHREEVAAQKRAYREAHREEDAARTRAYYEAHREEIAAQKRAYREAHREEIAARKRAYRAAKPPASRRCPSAAKQPWSKAPPSRATKQKTSFPRQHHRCGNTVTLEADMDDVVHLSDAASDDSNWPMLDLERDVLAAPSLVMRRHTSSLSSLRHCSAHAIAALSAAAPLSPLAALFHRGLATDCSSQTGALAVCSPVRCQFFGLEVDVCVDLDD